MASDKKGKVPLKEQAGSSGEHMNELQQQVQKMHIVSPKVVAKDCERQERERAQSWRSQRPELKQGRGKGRQPGARTPSSRNPKFRPEWQEIDDLCKCIRRILRKPMYKSDGRLSLEDEVQVKSVLEYHPKAAEKIGPGIDHIKIKEIVDEYTRCFWVVRTDGTEIDFSYHKCLKAKVAKEFPDLLEHYGSLYMPYRQLQGAGEESVT